MPRLVGDSRRLKQILMNLVRNAIKFTHFGNIDIFANFSDNRLSVDVRDTGHGIAEEDIPMLFTRFGKLQRTASLNHDGIGLGLNIVR